MSAKALVDTNILVYCYDRSDVQKQQRALEAIDGLAASGAGALSTQVLGEFFATVRRKLAAPLSQEDALARVTHYVQTWTVFSVTSQTVLEAARMAGEHRLHYWDAQVWAAARLNGIPLVLSEDFQDGSVLDGVRFLNPLGAEFRVTDWIE